MNEQKEQAVCGHFDFVVMLRTKQEYICFLNREKQS